MTRDKKDIKLLDLSYLKEMVGDDSDFMIEVLETFVKQTPSYMAELEDGLIEKDWDKVANSAHKIKPTFSYVGRDDVKDFIECIEIKARREENLDDFDENVSKLRDFLEEIYIQVDATITNLKN